MSTRWRNVCMRSAYVVELSRVVVLGSRPVEGRIVNELINDQTLLLKEYTWVARAVYNWSRQDPEAAYG
jgi:hypothetical protein